MEIYAIDFNSELKKDGSPVTEADLASSAIISEVLSITDIPILGEETEHQDYQIRKNWKLNWCVDPLDGTKEFIKRNGEFAVNIALIEKGCSIFGVIAWPEKKKVLIGGKNIGAYILDFQHLDEPEKWTKLHSKTTLNSPLKMISSRSHFSNQTIEFLDLLKINYPNIEHIHKGSALKFFDLTDGQADIYPRFAPTMEWDIAAGQAILEALGGEITEYDSGNSLRYNKESLFNPHFIAKTKAFFTLLFLIMSFGIHAQQNLIPIGSYFKDKLYSPFQNQTYNQGSFLPVVESSYDLTKKNADTSLQYYDFTELMLKHYLVEVKGEDFNFSITPLIDISMGKNKPDKIETKYYTNTRGLQIEGDLLKNFSFSTAFYENQSRFVDYERNYYLSVGELFPNSGSGYSTTNAVIPGGARTKPFKIGGFDYAFATGNIVYSPHKKVQLLAGNNQHFIGSGHRSLLLSDNSINAPYFQINYRISNKWSYTIMRQKLLNLMRRPVKSTDEAYYEPKLFSVNYLTFNPIKNISFSVFEGVVWNTGDSISTHAPNSYFYNPIIGLSEAVVKDKNQLNSLLGLNIEIVLFNKYRIYSQLASSNLDSKKIAGQIGIRGYNFFNVQNLMLQFEYNSIPNNFYQSTNTRLNYSHYNLPLAHTKGNAFQELVIRFNYEYKRFYIDSKSIIYQLNNFKENSLLPVIKNNLSQNNQLFHQQIEIGYRINRKINFTAFGAWIGRNDHSSDIYLTNYLSAGLRTGILNHYNDF